MLFRYVNFNQEPKPRRSERIMTGHAGVSCDFVEDVFRASIRCTYNRQLSGEKVRSYSSRLFYPDVDPWSGRTCVRLN